MKPRIVSFSKHPETFYVFNPHFTQRAETVAFVRDNNVPDNVYVQMSKDVFILNDAKWGVKFYENRKPFVSTRRVVYGEIVYQL